MTWPEELFGHLAEGWAGWAATGLDDDAAAARAIGDFGPADILARDLGRTYHSRLWASTVGVLVPASAPSADRPGAIGGLRFVLGIFGLLTAVGLSIAVFNPDAGPCHRRGSGPGRRPSATTLAFRGLGRGQRWALWFAIAVSGLMLVSGALDAAADSAERVIPLGAFIAVAMLHLDVRLLVRDPIVRRGIGRDRSPPRRRRRAFPGRGRVPAGSRDGAA